MKTVVMTLVVAATLAMFAGMTVIYTGLFDISTEWEDPPLVLWLLETTRENAVRVRAASIEVPPLKGAKQIEEGFRSFRDMCALCHTPPGATPSPTALGLNPTAPDLAEEAEERTSAELFWVIKNGIRMTGMPAWGWTHEDEELWDIVAFIKALPRMSEEEYRILDEKTPKGHSHGGEEHGHDDEGGGDHAHEDEGNEDHAH